MSSTVRDWRPFHVLALALSLALAGAFAAATNPALADTITFGNRWQSQLAIGVDAQGHPAALADAAGDAATWTIEPVDGTAFFRLKNVSAGRYLHAEQSTATAGVLGMTDATQARNWHSAHWRLRVHGNYLRLENRWWPGYALHAESQALTLGAAPDGWWSAQWEVELDSRPGWLTTALDGVERWSDVADADRERLVLAAYLAGAAPRDETFFGWAKRWVANDYPNVRLDGAARGDGVVSLNPPALDQPIANFKTDHQAWYSTGFFAAPGDTVSVRLPGTMVDQGLKFRVGVLADARPDHLVRYPLSLSETFEITAATYDAATETMSFRPAFGGSIMLEVPDGHALGRVEFTLANVVRAPVFELGRTTLADWRSTIRNRPAPMAELRSDKLSIIMPAPQARAIDDPETMLAYWDQVMDHQAVLQGRSQARKRPDRILVDIDAPPGAYTDGYRITVPMSWLADFTSTRPSWGFYHEIGHNHQDGAWTFAGTGEVTNNIFTVYSYETVEKGSTAGALALLGANDDQRRQRLLDTAAFLRTAMAGGGDAWADVNLPFAKLTAFLWLREAFGWEFFEQAFTSYRQPQLVSIGDDAEKRDQLLIRLSEAAGRDLSGFFDLWGIGASAAAEQQVAGLSDWRPDGTALGYAMPDSAKLVEPFGSGRGQRFALRDFDLGGGNLVWLEAGGRYRAKASINAHCPECGGAINQVILGFAGDDRASACAFSGTSTGDAWREVDFDLDVPTAPGVYELRARYAQAFNCQDALGWFKVDRPDGPGEAATVAVLVVHP